MSNYNFQLGWIPPDLRTDEAIKFTHEFHERISNFGVVGSRTTEIPERQIFAELELKHNKGANLPRVWQVTGSCVGSGAAQSYVRSMLADKIWRGDSEEVKLIFPFATYGIGRRKAGMNRPGDGSFGGAQAWACDPENFGYVAWDHKDVPKPVSTTDGWWKWSERVEYDWSYPGGWPVPENQISDDADDFGIHTITRVTSFEQLIEGFAQGYVATAASMFGTNPRVESDVLLGRWNTSWAHQMSWVPTFWKHPQHGWIIQCDNQWGPKAHPSCPTLSQYGVTGSFWILERDAEKVIRDGEVYLHSNTGGFPSREGFWNTQGFVYGD